jgi:hypothetical protein
LGDKLLKNIDDNLDIEKSNNLEKTICLSLLWSNRYRLVDIVEYVLKNYEMLKAKSSIIIERLFEYLEIHIFNNSVFDLNEIICLYFKLYILQNGFTDGEELIQTFNKAIDCVKFIINNNNDNKESQKAKLNTTFDRFSIASLEKLNISNDESEIFNKAQFNTPMKSVIRDASYSILNAGRKLNSSLQIIHKPLNFRAFKFKDSIDAQVNQNRMIVRKMILLVLLSMKARHSSADKVYIDIRDLDNMIVKYFMERLFNQITKTEKLKILIFLVLFGRMVFNENMISSIMELKITEFEGEELKEIFIYTFTLCLDGDIINPKSLEINIDVLIGAFLPDKSVINNWEDIVSKFNGEKKISENINSKDECSKYVLISKMLRIMFNKLTIDNRDNIQVENTNKHVSLNEPLHSKINLDVLKQHGLNKSELLKTLEELKSFSFKNKVIYEHLFKNTQINTNINC